jgi:branched-chain amino acid transport system ATP-binding protein
MLEVQGLRVTFGPAVALDGVELSVPDNGIVSVIGANGAGKTTLLRTISGLVKPDAGMVMWDGKPLPSKPHEVVKQGIVHVPEGRHVFPGLTVRENLVLGGYTLRSGGRIESRIDELFGRFPRLRERQNKQAGTLSGGEQQMLAVSRGLMAEPRLLMLDEPSLGLAPMLVDEVFALLGSIRDMGVSLLVVEQNAVKACGASDIVYVLEQGVVSLSGQGCDILDNPDVKRAYLGGGE